MKSFCCGPISDEDDSLESNPSLYKVHRSQLMKPKVSIQRSNSRINQHRNTEVESFSNMKVIKKRGAPLRSKTLKPMSSLKSNRISYEKKYGRSLMRTRPRTKKTFKYNMYGESDEIKTRDSILDEENDEDEDENEGDDEEENENENKPMIPVVMRRSIKGNEICDPCQCSEKIPAQDKELMDTQFCRWWGYKWLRDRENEIKQKLNQEFEIKLKKKLLERDKFHEMRHNQFLLDQEIEKKNTYTLTSQRPSILQTVTKKIIGQKLDNDTKKNLQKKFATPCSSLTYNNCVCNAPKVLNEQCTSTTMMNKLNYSKMCKNREKQYSPWVEKTQSNPHTSESSCHDCGTGPSYQFETENNVQYLSIKLNYIQSTENTCCDCNNEDKENQEVEEIVDDKSEESEAEKSNDVKEVEVKESPIIEIIKTTADKEMQYENHTVEQVTQTRQLILLDEDCQTFTIEGRTIATQTVPIETNEASCLCTPVPENKTTERGSKEVNKEIASLSEIVDTRKTSIQQETKKVPVQYETKCCQCETKPNTNVYVIDIPSPVKNKCAKPSQPVKSKTNKKTNKEKVEKTKQSNKTDKSCQNESCPNKYIVNYSNMLYNKTFQTQFKNMANKKMFNNPFIPITQQLDLPNLNYRSLDKKFINFCPEKNIPKQNWINIQKYLNRKTTEKVDGKYLFPYNTNPFLYENLCIQNHINDKKFTATENPFLYDTSSNGIGNKYNHLKINKNYDYKCAFDSHVLRTSKNRMIENNRNCDVKPFSVNENKQANPFLYTFSDDDYVNLIKNDQLNVKKPETVKDNNKEEFASTSKKIYNLQRENLNVKNNQTNPFLCPNNDGHIASGNSVINLQEINISSSTNPFVDDKIKNSLYRTCFILFNIINCMHFHTWINNA